MKRLHILTAPEQVAAHLREELVQGRWRRVMPGEDRLIADLGIGRHTVKAALKLLEEQGLLENQGPGRQRRVTVPKNAGKRYLRVRILLYEMIDRGLPDNIELLTQLRKAGFSADYSSQSLRGLGMDVERLARYVGKNPADAWVIESGSREVLEWFSRQEVPAIAMYGCFTGLPIAAASPRKTPALAQAVRKLAALGHHRIVMLTREERRKPRPALLEQNFLDELAALGIPVGPYNLPDWESHPAGLRACLDSLFRTTPPTALITEDIQLFAPVQQYLARHGIQVPGKVSLLCNDTDTSFAWCDPAISQIRSDYQKVVRRVVGWAENVASGKEDLKQRLFDAEFVEGGTIGPASARNPLCHPLRKQL